MDVRIVVDDEVARELLPELKEWLARIRSEIADQIHLRPINRDDDLAFMGTCFLSKQLDHAEALYQLVPRKDAILLARTMVEGLVQFLWAAKDEERAHLWRAHAVIEDLYRIPQMERRHQPPTAEMMAEMEEVLETVGPLFFTKKAAQAHAEGRELPEDPYHRSWRREVSLRHIFEDVEGGDLRRFFYGPYSAWAHWSAGTFGDRLSETEDQFTWSPVAEAYSGEALVFAIMCVLQTAGILFQHVDHEAVEVPGRLRDEFAEWHEKRLGELHRYFQEGGKETAASDQKRTSEEPSPPTADSSSDDRYAVFRESYQHSAEAKLKAHEQLDSYLLKFSAGALALSLSPATGLFETNDSVTRWLLVIAWLLYLVTIAATLWSFRASAKSCDDMVDIAYEAIVKQDDEGAAERHKEVLKSTHALNTLSIGSFLAALLLSLIYLAVTFLA